MSYRYSVAVLTDHAQVGADLVDFTIVDRGVFAALKSAANGGHLEHVDAGLPADFVYSITPDGLSPLPFAVRQYDPTTGELVAWVLLPNVHAAVNETIYRCYGDAGVTTYQGDESAAWDAHARGRWHMASLGALALDDGTGQNADLAALGTPTVTPGNIGGAVSLDGATELLRGALTAGVPYPVTLKGWVKLAASPPGSQAALLMVDDASFAGYGLAIYTSAKLMLLLNGGSGSIPFSLLPVIAALRWYFFAITISTGGVSVLGYQGDDAGAFNQDATYNAIGLGAAGGTTDRLSLGGRYDGPYLLDGSLDELGLDDVARSPEWLAAEYANQRPGSTFLSYGGEIDSGGGSGGFISHRALGRATQRALARAGS